MTNQEFFEQVRGKKIRYCPPGETMSPTQYFIPTELSECGNYMYGPSLFGNQEDIRDVWAINDGFEVSEITGYRWQFTEEVPKAYLACDRDRLAYAYSTGENQSSFADTFDEKAFKAGWDARDKEINQYLELLNQVEGVLKCCANPKPLHLDNGETCMNVSDLEFKRNRAQDGVDFIEQFRLKHLK